MGYSGNCGMQLEIHPNADAAYRANVGRYRDQIFLKVMKSG